MSPFYSSHCLAEQNWLSSLTCCFLRTSGFCALLIVLFRQWGYTKLCYGNRWSQHHGVFIIIKFIHCTCCMSIMGQLRLCSIILKWGSRSICDLLISEQKEKSKGRTVSWIWKLLLRFGTFICSHMSLPKATHMTMWKVNAAGRLILLQRRAQQGPATLILTTIQSTRIWS